MEGKITQGGIGEEEKSGENEERGEIELQVVLINNGDKVFWEQYHSSNPSQDHQATLIMNVFL